MTGCGDDDPIAPRMAEEEEEEVILTPIKLLVTKIYCDRWPEKKSSGSAWDTFGGKPDIYFQVGNHETEMFSNHQWQIVTHADFPSGQCRMNYGDTFTINMWDADSPSADDLMASTTFRPRDHYNQNNATNTTFRLYGNHTMEIVVFGTWLYK